MMKLTSSALLAILAAPDAASAKEDLLDLLFVGDVGHTREHSHRLTHPWPLNKASNEGSFSLYEGMYDYVTRQSANPNALLILGDVQYGGGDNLNNDRAKQSFQKYLNKKIPEDRVFVNIGNHDVHFLGCRFGTGNCYYGRDTTAKFLPVKHMNFSHWRSNWLEHFPGHETNTICPARQNNPDTPWLAPMRYNLNLNPDSSVYIIAGLNSGTNELKWNGDTPVEARDGVAEPELECEFLRDSLAHGKSLGKTVFIYMTHHFTPACTDWSILRQIDVWMYGHKHTFWQSPLSDQVVVQENNHYPVRLLIGNGGFDEGKLDVVSFGHLTEEIIDGGDRVRVNFKILDTCESAQTACPDTKDPLLASCWNQCKNFTGGFDNGGGARKANPSKHGYGFTFEAPRVRKEAPVPQAPYGGKYKMQVTTDENKTGWLYLKNCPATPTNVMTGAKCIRSTQDESKAAAFEFYDSTNVTVNGANGVSVRVAIDDEVHAPLWANSDKDGELLYRPGKGFWRRDQGSFGIHPSEAYSLLLTQSGSSASWKLHDVSWKMTRNKILSSDALVVSPGKSLQISFKAVTPEAGTPVQVVV